MSINRVPPKESAVLWLTTVLAISLASVMLCAKGMEWGAALFPDSRAYIEAARNFVHGHGLRVADHFGQPQDLRHFPPGYSLVLSAFAVCMGDVLEAAAGWNMTAFCLCTLGIIYLVFFLIGDSLIAKLLGLAFLFSPIMLYVFLSALSESLFIFTQLYGLLFFFRYLKDRRRLSLFTASLFVALGCITRFVGVSMVLTLFFVLLVDGRSSFRTRLLDACYFLLTSILPLLMWIGWNLGKSGSMAERTFGLKPLSYVKLASGIEALGEAFVPYPGLALWVGVLLLLGALLLCLSLMFRLLQGESLPIREKGLLVIGVYVFSYLSFLIVSLLFFDAGIPLDKRILSPLFPFFLIGVVTFISGRRSEGVRRKQGVLACLVFLLFFVLRSAPLIQGRYEHGFGFSSRVWVESNTLRYLRTLPESTEIFSNGRHAIYFHTGRIAYNLPAWRSSGKAEREQEYSARMLALRERLISSGGLVVYLRRIHWRKYLPNETELEKVLGLSKVVDLGDGAVYRSKPSHDLSLDLNGA